MKINRYLSRLRQSKYYTCKNLYHNYQNDNEIVLFLMNIDNILNEIYTTDNIGIRYNNQKELLKVLKYLLTNYKLYKIDSIYLKWNYHKNRYHRKLVWPREAMISSLISELQRSLGYDNKHNSNICLDFLNNYSNKLSKKWLNRDKVILELKRELDFRYK